MIQESTLDAGLSSSFSFYDFATEDITMGIGKGPGSFNNSPYSDADAYMFGRSQTDFEEL